MGECADIPILSAPSPVMEITDDLASCFYIHTLAVSPQLPPSIVAVRGKSPSRGKTVPNAGGQWRAHARKSPFARRAQAALCDADFDVQHQSDCLGGNDKEAAMRSIKTSLIAVVAIAADAVALAGRLPGQGGRQLPCGRPDQGPERHADAATWCSAPGCRRSRSIRTESSRPSRCTCSTSSLHSRKEECRSSCGTAAA